MAVAPLLTEEQLDALRQFDTCMIANAVETFNVRMRNTGFTDASIQCMFTDAAPMVGYAVTARLRSGEPPISGRTFRDRGDFWNRILEIPSPRVLVLQDMDYPSGRGAFVGDVHAAMLKALGCVGYLTNGAMRELPSVRTMGSSCLPERSRSRMCMPTSLTSAGNRRWNGNSTGRSFARRPPRCPHRTSEIAAAVPAVAAGLQRAEQEVIDFCRSSAFSVAELSEVMKRVGYK